MKFSVNQQHLQNAGLSRAGIKAKPKAYKSKYPKFELFQDDTGEWFLRFEKSKIAFPATDVEVMLWMRIKQLEEGSK